MSEYNHARQRLASQAVDVTNLKVLLTNGYTFDATETTMTAALAAEVSGNGWPSGGPVIQNVSAGIINTDEAEITGDDVSVTATGGEIGPATGLVVYDATNGWPLYHDSYSQTAGDGTPFLIRWLDGQLFVLAKPA